MLNKLYDKIKLLIKENYKYCLALIFLFLLLTFELPFYIETPGGILDVSTRVEVEGAKEVKGSFNLAYVSEFRATIPTLIYAYFNSDWDILKKEEVEMHETIEEIDYRNNLLLKEANQNAIIVGFDKANEYVMVTDRKINVIYVHEEADTDLKIGDQIISINGIDIESKKHLSLITDDIDGKMEIKVINDGKEYIRYASKVNIEGKDVIGIVLSEIKDVDTNLNVEFMFKPSESGPSGGFMMALSIYNYLIDEDITKGLKIVGTGTIDEFGNVGSIGGVEYKIKAAYKEKADLFFVPFDNYEEALKVVKEDNIDIKLVSIKNINEAIDYLNGLT